MSPCFTAKVTQIHVSIMLTLLLRLILAAHVAGEWVEISQNHYRKEPPRRVTLNHEAAANRVYINYSITERPWNRGVVTRTPNIGNIRRVQLPAKTINTLAIGSERVHSAENTKSLMELNTLDVRAPNTRINNRQANDETKTVKRKFSETFKVTDENATLKEKSKTRLQIPPKPFNPPEKNTNGPPAMVTPATCQEHGKQKIEEEAFKDGAINGKPETKESDRNLLNKSPASINDKTKPTEVTKYLVSLNNKKNKTEAKSNNNAMSNVRNVAKNSNEINESYTKEDSEFIHSTRSKDETHKTPKENEKANNEDAFQSEDGNLGSKKNTVDVIMKFMKVVTDNMSRNTRRSFRGKMRYLEDLRNNILANIEERIEQAWPDDTRQSTRHRRDARGHVEFPSSESALMTISFLTFAVFLIKLVLQVIHTYKNKTMMVTPAVVAAVGRAAETFARRN